MFKNFTLLFVFLFIASTSFAATVTVGGNIALRHDYVSDVDHDKDSKGDSTSEFRTYADVWFNSQINDQLSGLISLKLEDGTNQYETWGNDTLTAPVYPNIYEAYVNYLPIEGLNVRVGRQAWKMGNGILIGDYNTDSQYVSQSGLNLSYEMPELFKANLLVSIEDLNGATATPVEDKPVPASKFYALWLNTTALPGQNINLFYAVNNETDIGASSKSEIDDMLTTMGISASGGLPVGPALLGYGFDYFMNGGKDKHAGADDKYQGSYMKASVGGVMPQMYNLGLGFAYVVVSGDDNLADEKIKTYHRVHAGATMFTDSAKLFSGWNETLVMGQNIMIAKLSATPIKDLDASFEYIIRNANQEIDSIAMDGKALTKDMILKVDYKGLENLDLMFAVGQQKVGEKNLHLAAPLGITGKDGQLKTKLVATYKF